MRSALLALSFVVSSQAVWANDIVLTRRAHSGADTLLAYERSWNRNCEPNGSTVTLIEMPTSGTASVVEGTSTIPQSTPRFGSTGQCAGRPIAGKQVMYQSRPGFRGRDRVSWEVVYGNGSVGRTSLTIDVR